jgi:hypothetical protein
MDDRAQAIHQVRDGRPLPGERPVNAFEVAVGGHEPRRLTWAQRAWKSSAIGNQISRVERVHPARESPRDRGGARLFASHRPKREEINMNSRMKMFGLALMTLIAASTALLAPRVSRAYEDDDSGHRRPKLKLADLAGSWAISLGGNTGCGLSTLYVTLDLDATGSGSARTRGSSTGCPPGDDPAEPFEISSLNPDGSGTANLSCGPGCGWAFIIQVPNETTDTFTLVDIENPNNVLVGTAARKWPARSGH